MRVSALREEFHESATQIEESIADAMNKKKLFRRPLKDGSVSTLGVLAIVVIVGLVFYNGFSSLLALFRPPQLYFLPAIVALVAAGMIRAWRRSFPVFGRSAYGYALYKQTEGFREYLKTAEADQIIAESRQAEFSRYLPWAMAFGLEDLWAITIDHIAERTAVTAPNWYVGSDLSSFRDFADAAGSFSSMSADSMAYQPPTSGSSGGSGGFGGGSAGGGDGGVSAGGR
ncbi:hypothetical protein BSZ39_12315 [Bowdeniella nasicola]|uniref:Predicted membrane protein YciQ-like C-terminal domain-containing protein n=1 Tax=Bowdeniella nasicola TaxID=208480 RepID=A0A1Q5PZ59_9ACTO|nr:DUF2207 domain-containing protein [Bowdeniella nasicola]OKL52918.1 hypothetical protein BSZ39_12315 [Bowdeniella nasicola]